MSQPANKARLAILNVAFEGDKIKIEINDGRIVLAPLSWFPKLDQASVADRENFEISSLGYGIHWPTLDEDVSIKAFIS